MDRYWVGGSGTWNQTAHWSDTNGGAGGASVPTSSDNVFFTSLSASANYTVTMVTGAACLDMNWANPSSGKPTMAGSNMAINIYGSLTFVSGMGFTFTGTVNFKSTSTGKTITTAGVSLGSVNAYNIDGSGGEWTLQDNFSGFSSLNIKAGNLKTNAKSVTGGNVTVTGTTTRGLDLTNSTVTLSYQWNIGSTTNFTFVNTGSSIILNSNGAYFSGGGLSYNNFTINMNYNSVQNITSFSGVNTFVNLTLTGTNGLCRAFYLANNQNVSGTLTLTGYSQTRRLFIRGITGTATTIALGAAGTAVITNVDFMDITFTGTNTPVSGTSVGDCGGNIGITFTEATTRYWVGNGGSWSDINHWSASSNGAGGATMPLPHDTVVFDSYSITSASQTITIDIQRHKAIDFSSVANTPNITLSCDIWVLGSLNLTGTGTYDHGDPETYVYGVIMMGRGSYTLTSAGKDLYDFTVSAVGGTVTLQDNLTITDMLELSRGTLTVGAHDVRAISFYETSSATMLNMGSGTWTIFGSDNGEWSTETAGKVNCETSILKLTNEPAGTVYFYGGNNTFYIVWLTGNFGGAEWVFDYSNTFNTLKDDNNYAHQITFSAGTTQHITNWQVSGSAGALITITSDSIATHSLIKDGGGIVSVDYLDIQHSVATPSSTWYAGTHSTDHQGVSNTGSGWMFVVGSLRTMTDSVFLGASRITTMGKWLPRNMADNILYGASRVVALERDAINFARTLTDNILRGADRIIKLPAMYFMAMADNIMNGNASFSTSYTVTGNAGWPLYNGSAWGVMGGQTFMTPTVGGKPILDSCQFFIEKIGDVTIPTGNIYAKFYAHTGTFGSTGKATGSALAVSDPIDITTVLNTPNPEWLKFTFSGANRVMVNANTPYAIMLYYADGDSTYHPILIIDSSAPADPGNFVYSLNGTTFGYSASYDAGFSVSFVGRLGTVARIKTFVRNATDSIIRGASRLVSLTRTDGIFTRAMADSISIGASRIADIARIGKFIRETITNIAVAAWGIPTMGIRTVREMTDSILRGASRVVGLSRDAMNFVRALTHSTLISGTVANTSHFIRELVATLYMRLSSLFGAIWQIKPLSVLVKTIRTTVLKTKDLKPDIKAKEIKPDTSIRKIIINTKAETKNPSVKIKISSPNIGTKTIKPDINNKKPI